MSGAQKFKARAANAVAAIKSRVSGKRAKTEVAEQPSRGRKHSG